MAIRKLGELVDGIIRASRIIADPNQSAKIIEDAKKDYEQMINQLNEHSYCCGKKISSAIELDVSTNNVSTPIILCRQSD